MLPICKFKAYKAGLRFIPVPSNRRCNASQVFGEPELLSCTKLVIVGDVTFSVKEKSNSLRMFVLGIHSSSPLSNTFTEQPLYLIYTLYLQSLTLLSGPSLNPMYCFPSTPSVSERDHHKSTTEEILYGDLCLVNCVST